MTNIVPLGGDLERLSRKLEHEAQLFLARKRDGHLGGSRRWIIFDLEFRFDRSRHAGYIQAEGKDAELSIRWPFHQVAAVCWMTLEFVPGETVPVVQGPFVVTAEDADERALVTPLFDALEQDLGAVATTWGGEARDLAVLRRAAATHGLVLPHQLIDGSPHARSGSICAGQAAFRHPVCICLSWRPRSVFHPSRRHRKTSASIAKRAIGRRCATRCSQMSSPPRF